MTSRKSIAIEAEDIAAARRGEAEDPFVHALKRILGTRWTMAELQGVALETRAPFRAILLPPKAIARLEHFTHSGKMQPWELTVDIYETSEFVTTVLARSAAVHLNGAAADGASPGSVPDGLDPDDDEA